MVQACYDAKDIAGLIEVMTTLAKKRSVVKQGVTLMVQRCMEFVDQLPNTEEAKFTLIAAIREVTEGKIFVEVQRARVTRTFAQIREAEGKIREAAELMTELQVETFGSMDKRERIDFILEQLRLLLTVGEFSKAQIVSRKISPKVFEAIEFLDLKLRYYALMIQLCLHDKKYLDCSQYHYRIYQADKAANVAHLAFASIFVVMAKHDNEQVNQINVLNGEKDLEEKAPVYKELVRLFLTRELIRWSQIDALFTTELKSCYVFVGDNTKAHTDDLKDRVIEHNIRVVSTCFRSTTLDRLAVLLDLTPVDTEAYLCRLIIDHMISGKIDRISGTVLFKKPLSPEETLNVWASKTDALLNLMVRTNHAISKEEMTKAIQ